MERIEERSMKTFVLSSLINFGIGLVVGLVLGIIATIMTEGYEAGLTMIGIPLYVAVLVTLLTKNMYRIYFYYKFSMDVNTVCEGDGLENENYLLSCVLDTATFGLYHIYWTYKIAQRLRANAPKYGFKMMETGKEIAILDVFSFNYISTWELIKNMNRIAVVYNNQVGGVQ